MRVKNSESEADIQKTILAWLRLWGAFPIRVNSGATVVAATASTARRFIRANSEPGCSDILCCLPDGRFAAIEVKRPGGKLTELQASFLDAVRKAGGLAFVARSLDDVIEALRMEGYET